MVANIYIYIQTGSPLALGLIGLIQFAPQFFLILPAGVIADKYNRRHILIICNIVQVFVAGFLLYYSVYKLDDGSVIPIYLILILHGVAMSFEGPSSFAILPNLVKSEIFPRAVHYVNFFEEFGSLAGPIAAGILIAYINEWVYLVALISFSFHIKRDITSRYWKWIWRDQANKFKGFAQWVCLCLENKNSAWNNDNRYCCNVV